MSLFFANSATELEPVAPPFISFKYYTSSASFILSWLKSKAFTLYPPLTRFKHMGSPIFPSPMNPSLVSELKHLTVLRETKPLRNPVIITTQVYPNTLSQTYSVYALHGVMTRLFCIHKRCTGKITQAFYSPWVCGHVILKK